MKPKFIIAMVTLIATVAGVSAKNRILVNNEVTTHIVMPENVKMVDISTTKIAGNQCNDNIVRIKPYIEGQDDPNPDNQPAQYQDNELIGTLTLIGERHIAQYDVVYTASPTSAASVLYVPYTDLESYVNPDVTMPEAEMARYAWAVYGSGRKYNQIMSKKHGMKAVINNIFSIGDFSSLTILWRTRQRFHTTSRNCV